MDPFLAWVEGTAWSVWLRESLSVFAFPTVLLLHTVGLAFLVGPCLAISLKVLGALRPIPGRFFDQLYPLLWAGFVLSLLTGLALLTAYPTKALTNPLFYVKLVVVATALVAVTRVRPLLAAEPPPAVARRWAWASAVLWIAAIFAGRFLAYTYSRLLVGH